jgi:hypothetical protein
MVQRKRSFLQAFFCFQFKNALSPVTLRQHSSADFHMMFVVDMDEWSSDTFETA